ncbi:hypothetical protein Taro_056307, partial [Colocasia esculenta]|nr:hypothetical protein [Colocasia esculenta]
MKDLAFCYEIDATQMKQNIQFKVLAKAPIGVNPWPLRWCQRPALDANTHSGVQRSGRQLLWPASAAELLSSET